MSFLHKTSSFKLYISPYTLCFKNKLYPPIKGSLLAFDFKEKGTGYSDFLPWPAFQEEDLFEQLQQAKRGIFSQRFLLAKQNAWLDAKAREAKQSLFFGLKIPPSHYLISDLLKFNSEKEIKKQSFQFVKTKLKASHISKQIQKIKALHGDLKPLKWRFDLQGQSFHPWRKLFHFLKEDLDFIEDPLERIGFKNEEKSVFAEDWISSAQLKIKIIKASRDSFKDLLKGLASFRWKRMIFTHSFDHPLGQVTTAFWAGKFYKVHPSFFETGAFTHPFFKSKAYPLKAGPKFIPSQGFGFGFGASLKKRKMEKMALKSNI